MEHACNEAYELFPSPERIDKVEDSMENLEAVVRERNEAYFQLETGETGERPSVIVHNCLGNGFSMFTVAYFFKNISILDNKTKISLDKTQHLLNLI